MTHIKAYKFRCFLGSGEPNFIKHFNLSGYKPQLTDDNFKIAVTEFRGDNLFGISKDFIIDAIAISVVDKKTEKETVSILESFPEIISCTVYNSVWGRLTIPTIDVIKGDVHVSERAKLRYYDEVINDKSLGMGDRRYLYIDKSDIVAKAKLIKRSFKK